VVFYFKKKHMEVSQDLTTRKQQLFFLSLFFEGQKTIRNAKFKILEEVF